MVELAAGPFENAEKLPVVIRVPKLMGYSVMSVCSVPVSVLGFGDIIVPGLLIAYCRRFDVQTGSSIYYISSTIAYAVGMIITFVVLMVMKTGQPALLYLVPCTLITASIIAWSRKEMKKFWKGSSYQVCAYKSPAVMLQQIFMCQKFSVPQDALTSSSVLLASTCAAVGLGAHCEYGKPCEVLVGGHWRTQRCSVHSSPHK